MNRNDILDVTESVLNKAGFRFSLRCTSRSSCFDIAAHKKNQIVFIKAYTNIGNISTKDALELQAISECLFATPLIIGDRTRRKSLKDDTVYSRYNIQAMTTKTLENIVCYRQYPLVQAGPGGYYIELDESLIRKKRRELELSIGKLAEMAGISRRTMYGYERAMAKASVSTAYKLGLILGVPVAKFVNVLRFNSKCADFPAARNISYTHPLKTVFEKLRQFGFRVARIEKAPFDFIAICSKKKLRVVGGITIRREQNIDQRTEEIKSISETIDAFPVLVTYEKKIKNNNITIIDCEDLENIRDPEDFIGKL